ncbi:hypothetical protein BDN70DRAFT_815370, partial [Pholiota conissans]
GIRMEVDDTTMFFKRDGGTLFIATITSHNTGILDTSTEPITEFANAASTLPMDINLWHRCCAHHSHASIMQLSKDDLVFGLVLSSKGQPDLICEPCLAGKMTSAPFPSSTRQSTQPLELIHSDLHGPLPVHSPDGH